MNLKTGNCTGFNKTRVFNLLKSKSSNELNSMSLAKRDKKRGVEPGPSNTTELDSIKWG
ncbi:hypothetical protein KFE94_17385 [bacterium SCSIO 12643]|nr:hypothetical protein KFE94_17385 [bacterium SCSIO 12643]